MPRSYSTEGIVLSHRDWHESDRMLLVLTEERGKLTLIAKGIRKPLSRKSGSLEPFSVIRFSVQHGHGIGIVTEAEIIDAHEPIRKDLKRIAVAYYFAEVVQKLTQAEEGTTSLYVVLKNALIQLDVTTSTMHLRKIFVRDALVTLGYWPQSDELSEPDSILTDVIERRINSVRVGRKLLD